MNLTSRNVWIVSLVAFVNMLGYGIIIPIIYAYSKKFGLTDFQNGLLFALFSVCQFISTPIIGRLSDKYGRRPMLLLSIGGTVVSFFVMAVAPSAIFLFLARILDGLTAGNIPVIFSVISDSTKPKDRAQAFGRIGSAFSLGFIFGPAIAALTVGFGAGIPFWIAGIITFFAILIVALFLPETNTHLITKAQSKLFDFPQMWHTLFDQTLGRTFLITLIFFMAFSCALIYGFQPFTQNILKISESQNAYLFTLFGIVGFITQNLIVGRVVDRLGTKSAFSSSIFMTAISFFIMFISRSLGVFVFGSVILALFNSIAQTMIPTLLSELADTQSQGSIMGLNTSYQSIGMIVGPLLGGFVASFHIPLPFLVGGILVLLCFYISTQVIRIVPSDTLD